MSEWGLSILQSAFLKGHCPWSKAKLQRWVGSPGTRGSCRLALRKEGSSLHGCEQDEDGVMKACSKVWGNGRVVFVHLCMETDRQGKAPGILGVSQGREACSGTAVPQQNRKGDGDPVCSSVHCNIHRIGLEKTSEIPTSNPSPPHPAHCPHPTSPQL